MALIQPLYSGDPDVMQFSRSTLRFERLAPSPTIEVRVTIAPSLAIWTSTRPINYIRLRIKLSHDPQLKELASWLEGSNNT